MKRALMAGTGLLVCGTIYLAWGAGVVGGDEVGVTHRGDSTVVRGRGASGDVGFLGAGRYHVSTDRSDGCAIGLSLVGADRKQVYRLNWYTNNGAREGDTGVIPAQKYSVTTDVYFGDGLPGPGATPEPDCRWRYEFQRLR